MALEEAVEDCLGVRRHFAAGDRHRVAEQGHPRAQQLLEGFFEDRVVVVVLQTPQQIHTSTEEIHMKSYNKVSKILTASSSAAARAKLQQRLASCANSCVRTSLGSLRNTDTGKNSVKL